MKFIMTVRNSKTSNTWDEEYDYNEVNEENAEKFTKDMIDRFNSGLRPGESPRELVSVRLSGDSTGHRWDKDLLRMSSQFRGAVIDGMICRTCGVQGKRFGLTGHVKIDSKYKRKVFQTCTQETNSAVQELS